MKQDVVRTKLNNTHKNAVDDVVRTAKKGVATKKKGAFISQAYAVIDTSSKKKVIHRNKAARLKRRVSRLVSHTT